MTAIPRRSSPPADLPTPETPQERQARIARAVQDAQNLAEDIKQGTRSTRQTARDDQVMRKAYRRAVAEKMSLSDLAVGLGGIPGLTSRDVMLPDMEMPGYPPSADREFLTEEFPTRHDDMIMEDLHAQNNGTSVQRQPPTRRQLTEQQPQPRRSLSQDVAQRVSVENWKIKRYLGETRNGAEVHIWKVENTKTGSSLRNLFRIEGVASRIAMILNRSGDINDPQALSTVNAYEKRDKLLKEAKLLEKTSTDKQMKTERLRQIRLEITELDYKLGI